MQTLQKVKNVPDIRFTEFTEEWQSKKLSQLSKRIGDGIHSTPQYDEYGNYYFVNGNNLMNGKIIINIDTKRVNDIEAEKHYRSLNTNTLLLSINGTIGNVAFYNNEKILLGKSACYINLNDNVSKTFLFYLLQSKTIKRYFSAELTGTTIKNLSLKSISNTNIVIPNLSEQQKIASFLSLVDEWIENLRRQKESLEKFKKGMMQKLFTQQIRFKDENGEDFPDWEYKQLNDVGEIVGGGTPDTTKSEYWKGKINWFTPTEIKEKYIYQSTRKISEAGLRNSSVRILPVGTVLLTSRATIADVSIACEECTTNQGFQSIIVNSKNYNEFLYYWIKFNKNEFFRKANGSTFLEISGKEMRKIKILLPSYDEQVIIGDFLCSIDKLIELKAKKINQSELWKKGLMQKMFI